MKAQSLLIALTVLNAGLLSYQLIGSRPGVAAAVDVAPVIRARAPEIVDEHGRVRASLRVLPEDLQVMRQGARYPETVLLRLHTADGRPNVKLGASQRG